uniref:Uncharacterized protein n=1 Tax=Rhizophora mucronata TaxID=61149 RepID=A0A2P2PX10_RHIMU
MSQFTISLYATNLCKSSHVLRLIFLVATLNQSTRTEYIIYQ